VNDEDAAREGVRDRLSLLRHMDIDDHGTTMMLELMGVPSAEDVTPGLLEGAVTLRTHNHMMLAQTELFIGTDEVCGVLNEFAPSYPDATLFLSDILVPFGMVWFADPIDDPSPMQPTPIRALSWTLSQPGDSVIHLLGHTHDKPVLTILGYTDTETLSRKGGDLQNHPRMYPIVSVLWEIDTESGGILFGPDIQEITQTLRSPYIRLLMAYWALMRQRLFVPAEPVDRVMPRQVKYARRRAPNLNDKVHIVRLRRRTSSTYSGFHGFNRPDWKNQWVVRPHWREQWYPSTEEHKLILVWSYIKGPEDKPLIGAERAFLPPKPKQ
jgi:hypothetical protein